MPCPGYVVNHVVALRRGGADEPGNIEAGLFALESPSGCG
jgi:hypothetical protein